ncbi:MAG TPA: hypothetical protein PLS50_04700, partial [Candidatus Dojkabacteria bacterium]|nr:hypothetical protein [Candidatus Dojkabacteria bacterium]
LKEKKHCLVTHKSLICFQIAGKIRKYKLEKSMKQLGLYPFTDSTRSSKKAEQIRVELQNQIKSMDFNTYASLSTPAPSPSGSKTQKKGEGIGKGKVYDPYKMAANGIFGNLQISVPELQRLMLRVHKNGRQIAYQPAPYDLLELLTKKYNTRRQYHPDAIDLFGKLVRHADIPISSTNSAKYKHIISKLGVKQDGSGTQVWDPFTKFFVKQAAISGNNNRMLRGEQPIKAPEWVTSNDPFIQKGNGVDQDGGCACEGGNVMIYSDPDEVANRLHILLGEVSAGNTAKEVKNEISQLIDWLKTHGHIQQEDYTTLMKASGLYV